MRRILEAVGDAIFVLAVLPFALVCAWLASREERRNAAVYARDAGRA